MGAIVGIGVDVVDVKRMKVVLDARGPALIKKLHKNRNRLSAGKKCIGYAICKLQRRP